MMSVYADHGVNRISLGVQSTSPTVLAALGRTHTRANVQAAAHHIAAAGIERYNVDLIFGTIGETDADFEQTLHDVMALDPAPTHVSAYALIAEPGTPLGRDLSRHPDDDVQASRYEIADRVLSSYGLDWYEISNWAKPGHACAHNQLYWDGSEYIGVGCAAHSHRRGHRSWTVRTPDRYIAAINEQQSPLAGEERLGAEEHALELLQLALRTTRGVPRDTLDTTNLEQLVSLEEGRWVLTLKGRLLANEIAIRLRLPAVTSAPS
jgi:oxygen-independent coproporphyrinogen-3 oxidase